MSYPSTWSLLLLVSALLLNTAHSSPLQRVSQTFGHGVEALDQVFKQQKIALEVDFKRTHRHTDQLGPDGRVGENFVLIYASQH